MSNFANLQGLNNFRRKLKNLKMQDINYSEILRKICEAGIQYAKQLYNTEKIELYYEIKENFAVITAKGDEVAYIEFGTGEAGRGSYEGELPDEKLEFFSNRLNRDVSLDGWTYSYANEIDDNQPFWVGFSAKAQMWKTSQYLRNNIVKIIQGVVNQ